MRKWPSYLIVTFPMLLAAFLLGIGLGQSGRDQAAPCAVASTDASSGLWAPASLNRSPQYHHLSYTHPFEINLNVLQVAQDSSGTETVDRGIRFCLEWDEAAGRFVSVPSAGAFRGGHLVGGRVSIDGSCAFSGPFHEVNLNR
jgi:hypothetical protein